MVSSQWQVAVACPWANLHLVKATMLFVKCSTTANSRSALQRGSVAGRLKDAALLPLITSVLVATLTSPTWGGVLAQRRVRARKKPAALEQLCMLNMLRIMDMLIEAPGLQKVMDAFGETLEELMRPEGMLSCLAGIPDAVRYMRTKHIIFS